MSKGKNKQKDNKNKKVQEPTVTGKKKGKKK